MVRRVEAICLLLVMFACPLSAAAVEDSEPTSPTYQEYLDASRQATEYFLKMYTEIGDRVRRGEVLQKCGYKKEADELDARTLAIEKVMIKKSIEEGVASKKLASNTAILIARESAISLFAGYRFGFGESFALTRDSLLARDYEDLCKAALRKAQEWQKEGR